MYYKWVLGIVALLALIVSIVVTGIVNSNIELLLSGELVNIILYQDGYDYLCDDYFEILQGVEGKQKVEVYDTDLGLPTSDEIYQKNYYTLMRTSAEVSNQTLDYMMMDQYALSQYISDDIFMYLTEILTTEELAALEGKIVYVYFEETEEQFPVAIDITESGYAKKYLDMGEEKVFFAFIGNTPRKETVRAFWDYLMACEAE